MNDGDALSSYSSCFHMMRISICKDELDAWLVCPSSQFSAEASFFLIIFYTWNYNFYLLHFLTIFNFSPLSLATIAGYWLWFLYLKYLKMESEASKEVTFKYLKYLKYLKYHKYLKYLKMESEASKEVSSKILKF